VTERHAKVLEILPWYVNGTLTRDEQLAVQRHVGECLPCRIALEEERRLQALVRQGHAVPDMDDGFKALLRRIDREERAGDGREPRTARSFAGSTWRWGLAAAAGASLIALLVWVTRSPEPARDVAAPFATLSAPSGAAGQRIDVVFDDTVSAAQISAIFSELDVSIVEGPSDIGRYTIEVPEGDGRDLGTVLDALRTQRGIRLAAPSFASETPQ
jgi:anti-sigma factor RsiW